MCICNTYTYVYINIYGRSRNGQSERDDDVFVGERVVCIYSFALCSAAPTIREIGLLVDLQDLRGLVGLVGEAYQTCAQVLYTSWRARRLRPMSAQTVKCTKSGPCRNNANHSKLAEAGGLEALEEQYRRTKAFEEQEAFEEQHRRTFYRGRGNKGRARRQVDTYRQRCCCSATSSSTSTYRTHPPKVWEQGRRCWVLSIWPRLSELLVFVALCY